MLEGSTQVNIAVEKMASIAKDSVESTQSVTVSSGKQLQAMEEITDAAALLNRLSQDLQDVMNRIKDE